MVPRLEYGVSGSSDSDASKKPGFQEFRLQLAIVTTVLIFHLMVGVSIILEASTVSQAMPADLPRLAGALSLGTLDILVFLIFFALLFKRLALYERYRLRFWLVCLSFGVHLIAGVAIVSYEIVEDGWRRFEQQTFHSETKRDIASTAIIVLSGLTMLLASCAIGNHLLQRRKFYNLRKSRDESRSDGFRSSRACTSADLAPSPYANRVLFDYQRAAHTRSPDSPYRETVKLANLGSISNDTASGPLSPAHKSVINELKHTLGSVSSSRHSDYDADFSNASFSPA